MDDAAFLDDEIYDDDDLGHHAADDDDVAGILAPRAEDDATALGEAMDLFPASCFTPEYLSELAGTADLASCAFLEMRADTTDEDGLVFVPVKNGEGIIMQVFFWSIANDVTHTRSLEAPCSCRSIPRPDHTDPKSLVGVVGSSCLLP